MLRSEADAGPVTGQTFVALRLSRRHAEALAALLEEPTLAPALSRVEEAGCEVLPEWACGAVLLAPLTQDEASEVGLELRAHHVVVAQFEQALVESALRAGVRYKRRPHVRQEDAFGARPQQVASSSHSFGGDGNGSANQHSEPIEDSGADVIVEVERTFVHFPVPKAAWQTSGGAVCSELWGGIEGNAEPMNPHSWRLP